MAKCNNIVGSKIVNNRDLINIITTTITIRIGTHMTGMMINIMPMKNNTTILNQTPVREK